MGFDTQVRLLETIVLLFESGEEMVIHAMPARKKYLDLLP
ncbi:toxin-antitoxin system toxin subunit [Knoellia sinensis]